jgi:hypothetical protein
VSSRPPAGASLANPALEIVRGRVAVAQLFWVSRLPENRIRQKSVRCVRSGCTYLCKWPAGGRDDTRENIMATTSILAQLSATTAALAASAMLFLGAGTAQADILARATAAPGGVDVLILSDDDDPANAPSGWCTYTSTVRGNPIGKPLPAINVPIYVQARVPSRLWFPSFPTGSTWDIKVNCPNAGPQFTTVVW